MVLVFTLMEGLEAEEERRWAIGGGGPTMLPMDGRLVVAEGRDGMSCQGNIVGKDVEMCDVARQFELGVGDVASWVVAGYQARS